VFAGACAREVRMTPRTDVAASPRVIPLGQPIPKGGGVYKVGNPYRIEGALFTPAEDPGYDRTGVASFYSEDFHGRRTANGEIFDMWALTAAHPTLPLPSYAYVTNLANGRTLLVRINDRGPYARGRVIDLSRASARLLGFEAQGTSLVRVRYAGRAPLNGDDHYEQHFLSAQRWYRVAVASPTWLQPSR
jgi:rare lipoprotein A